MHYLLILLSVYFVSFTDKPEKTAPQLSPRAVEQRAKWNIPTDGMDYPVSPMYMGELTKMGVKIYHKSRWFNGVTCEMDAKKAAQVAELRFVKNVEMTREDNVANQAKPHRIPKWEVEQVQEAVSNETLEEWTAKQLALYNLTPLHDAGFEGQGILMSICDGSFYNAQQLSCFRPKQLQLGAFDFTDDTGDFYGSTGAHGTQCLSTISGISTGYYGAATKAPYYLMRSEESDPESPKEMDNLVAALETADSLGVNVFSVSLGYAMFDNSAWDLDKTTDLDGKSTRASLAATIAARKGMLVCAAAGNEGNKTWKTICAPADADSILTVGAVAVDSMIGSFSSYGPSSDGRIKPDVCAVGAQAAVITPDGTIVRGNGTSFATPLIAGLAASLWSALPDENAMQIRERIILSSDRYLSPDSTRYGYGIPNAWKAYTMKLPTDMGNGQWKVENGKYQKILRNGQILILRNGQTYTISGLRIGD